MSVQPAANNRKGAARLNSPPHASYVYVDTREALGELIGRMGQAERVAVDTEADSLYHYFEKVCLIQVSVAGDEYLVDPLCGIDLAPFLAALSDTVVILHDAGYDLRMLRASFGFRPGGEVFDTMLAAQLLGHGKFGLAAMLGRYFGVVLSKHGQKADWSRRPLSTAQLEYAACDTRHLQALADTLRAELQQRGRLDWHRESCERMVEATARDPKRDPDNAWRIKGLKGLDRRQLCFVREVWLWRDGQARAADLPPFKVLGNQQLLDVALRAATQRTGEPLSGVKLPRNCTGRRLAALEQAIREARGLPQSEWPRPRPREPRRGAPPPSLDALRAESARVAGGLGIDPAVLAPRAMMEAVALQLPESVEEIIECSGMMRWQADLLAAGLLRILHGA